MRTAATLTRRAEESPRRRDRAGLTGLAAPHAVLDLQRLAGNAAVSRAIAGGPSAAGAVLGVRGEGPLPRGRAVSAAVPPAEQGLPAPQRTVGLLLQREPKPQGAPGQRPDLVLGDSGPGVTQLQQMLGVTQTGLFDQETRVAVDRFQRQQGWEPSGVGPQTWQRLDGHAGVPGRRPNLVAGDRGPGVRLLQQMLGVTETAFFDQATRTAVDAFQRSQDWEPSGVGPQTWKRLDKAATPASKCQVKSFDLRFEAWEISWPWTESKSGTTTIRLPVKFTLELEPGSSRSDCLIYQQKKGAVYQGCDRDRDRFPNLVPDGPNWWDGKDWRGGDGSWSGTVAKFADAPGFGRPGVRTDCYPIYYGGLGEQGNFEFRTIVADKDLKVLRTLDWGLFLSYSKPRVGRHSHS